VVKHRLLILAIAIVLTVSHSDAQVGLNPEGVPLVRQHNSGGGTISLLSQGGFFYLKGLSDLEGIMQLRTQVISSDGEFLYDDPPVFSPDSLHALLPRSVGCLDEGAYVSWFERPERSRWLLWLQKVDNQGRPVWNERGILFREIITQEPPSIQLLADSEGGFLIRYDLDYRSSEILFGFDENGNLKDGWPDNGIVSDSTRFREVLPDPEGGFWIVNLDLTLNRLSTRGEWVWDEDVDLSEIFREDDGWHPQFKAANDFLYGFNREDFGQHHSIVIFGLDGEVVHSGGVIFAENEDWEDRNTQEALWFVDSENSIYILYANFNFDGQFENQDGMPWVKRYDPFERDHEPWGWDGIQLPEVQWGGIIDWFFFDMAKLGDVLILLGNGRLYSLSADGEPAWEEFPRRHQGFGGLRSFLCNGNECWVRTGSMDIGYIRLNELGDIVSGDEQIRFLPIERKIARSYIPLINGDRLSVLFYDEIRGLVGQSVNIQGEVSEPLDGTVIELEGDNEIEPLQVGVEGEHHWIWQRFDEENGILSFLNADIELVGSLLMAYNTVLADDRNEMLLMRERVQEGEYILTCVDINGEILAENWIELPDAIKTSWYWPGNGWVMVVGYGNNTYVYLLDNDLQTVWDEPLFFHHSIDDMRYTEDELTLAGYIRLAEAGHLIGCWDYITSDGELIESVTTQVVDIDLRRNENIWLNFASNGNIWFRFNFQGIGYTQLVGNNGEHILGNNGFPFGNWLRGVSDLDGGGWLFSKDVNSKINYIHIDENGRS